MDSSCCPASRRHVGLYRGVNPLDDEGEERIAPHPPELCARQKEHPRLAVRHALPERQRRVVGAVARCKVAERGSAMAPSTGTRA